LKALVDGPLGEWRATIRRKGDKDDNGYLAQRPGLHR
jgi:hypothetical protein